MEKNKIQYITIVFIICLIFTGIGCFYLGTFFGEKQCNLQEDATEVNGDIVEMD